MVIDHQQILYEIFLQIINIVIVCNFYIAEICISEIFVETKSHSFIHCKFIISCGLSIKVKNLKKVHVCKTSVA
jgi:hypothetical protein